MPHAPLCARGSSRIGPITEASLKTALRRAVPDAGVKNFRFHDTRHTTATNRVLRESNLRVVQELLGHRDIATTTKYAHAVKEEVRNALDAIGSTKSPANETGVGAKGLKGLGGRR